MLCDHDPCDCGDSGRSRGAENARRYQWRLSAGTGNLGPGGALWGRGNRGRSTAQSLGHWKTRQQFLELLTEASQAVPGGQMWSE